MNAFEPTRTTDCPSDASLLEGLYQLVVNGHTDGWEFEQLDTVVYERLKHTYAVTL